MLEPIANSQPRWNFGDSRGTSISLDEFLDQKEAYGVEFFAGKEPWLVGLHKLRHPVIKDAIKKALTNRFPAR